jgi:hypothetical protein
MITIELTKSQTKKFWNDCCDAIDWDMDKLDDYMYNTYSITSRKWITMTQLELTIEQEHYATWLKLL